MVALAPPPDDPLFEPFIRRDAYGEGGRRVGPLARLRVAALACTLLPARLAAALACVAGYYLLLRALSALPDGVVARRAAAAWGRVWSRACLLALGFARVRRVRVPPPPGAPALGRPRWQVAIVSNHVGWADILVHMSRNLPSFVARDGTQNIRMIGLIRRAPCAATRTRMRACACLRACGHARACAHAAVRACMRVHARMRPCARMRVHARMHRLPLGVCARPRPTPSPMRPRAPCAAAQPPHRVHLC